MAKKKNSRKVLAVALGIMGIAGLSLASASQLTINTSNEVGAGVKAFGSNCQGATPIAVDYNYDATTLKITGVKFTGIAAGCATHSMTFTLGYTPVSGTLTTLAPAAHTIVAGDATLYTEDVTAAGIPLTAALGNVTIIIK
jgi:hypothetical protein